MGRQDSDAGRRFTVVAALNGSGFGPYIVGSGLRHGGAKTRPTGSFPTPLGRWTVGGVRKRKL